MLYDYDGDGDHFSAEFLQVAGLRCAIRTNIGIVPYGLRSVPTHTEDGIPIRKLFVSNLPPKTTRKELFEVFCQYGFIKSCWVRAGETTPSSNPGSSYAFITFKNPDDAHKALQAPKHEKSLRGWNLRTFPADSWHQPVEEADGQVIWKNKGQRDSDFSYRERNEPENEAQRTLESGESSNCESNTQVEDEEESYNILDVLNNDCLTHILSYVPIRDLIRSERVSKGWQVMVNEYLNGYRTFKTSWWQHGQVMLTTAILRKILQRLGPSLQRLHIDHRWSALNDRTAHTVGKFCPNLEELKIVSMHTKNWNPLVYGCKQLKAITFVSCNKLTDANLVHLVQNESCIEKLAVAYNSHVTGLFLTGANPPKLKSLSFFNCFSLQGTVLNAAMDTLSNLTTLKLDVGPVLLWKMIPSILNKLPKLEELSLSQYSSMQDTYLVTQGNSDFCESIAKLTELKYLNVNRNIYISDVLLKQVAQSCRKLEYLNVSNCNPRKSIVNTGVTDVGISAVCNSCTLLRILDVSYLSQLTNEGIAAAARCSQLSVLTSRGNAKLLAQPFAQCVASCHNLKEVDVCGCNNVTEELVYCAVTALKEKPRSLLLRLASTAVMAQDDELPTHRLLTVNLKDDLCDPQLRPDFVDRMFDESSDDSLDDYDFFDPDNYEDFMDSDNGFNLDELVEDFEYMYGAYEDVVLL